MLDELATKRVRLNSSAVEEGERDENPQPAYGDFASVVEEAIEITRRLKDEIEISHGKQKL